VANVVLRPTLCRYEIAVGTTAGVPGSDVIPLDELVVGLRDNRFYLRWPARQVDVRVCAGHMLNPAYAPALARFLAEMDADARPQLAPFDWGAATAFPFLPRVTVGRCVLSLARWRLDTATLAAELPAGSATAFRSGLARWRERWRIPRRVYLTAADQRLLLDLCEPGHVEEMRAEVRRQSGGSVLVQEAIPDLDDAWVCGPGGRYMAEFVVPLALRERLAPPGAGGDDDTAPTGPRVPEASSRRGEPAPPSVVVRPPGSDWLYVRLYCARPLEEDLITGPLRDFVRLASRSGWAEEWFFVRYRDPETHVRLRFRGDPARLTSELLPALYSWAAGLMAGTLCTRFTIDTYEREVDRYGGQVALGLVEQVFAADSEATADLLGASREPGDSLDRTAVAVWSVDDLLASLGLDVPERTRWCHDLSIAREPTSTLYRRMKSDLRSLLGAGRTGLPSASLPAVSKALSARHDAVRPLGARLRSLAVLGELSHPLSQIHRDVVHMHLNRLLGVDRAQECVVLGLLGRTREALRHA
jgi:thiopeptide-type bacteriocin biosynthesis protein